MTVTRTLVTMIFWQKLQFPWCIFVMDHPRVFLFHKMWLFLWVRLQFAGQLNFVFLFYTGLYWFISLTETRVIVELKNMSAVWHYEADVSLVFFCLFFMTQPSSCADGSGTSLMFLSVYVRLVSFLWQDFTLNHAWACPNSISLEVC